MTVLLAFDTSTEVMALALQVGARHHGLVAPGGAKASAELLPALRRLLAGAGLAWADVQAIGFGRGPGAFTGLRTSCAVAQGLGFGLGRPLLAIDSLLIVAEDARAQLGAGDGFEIGVAMDARMDEVYAGRYRRHAGAWQTVGEPALYTLPALSAAWRDAPAAVAGSALAAFGDRLVLAGTATRVPDEADRAAALGRLARTSFEAGATVEAAAALPLYLRDKVALTTEERAAARAAVP